MSAAKLLQIDGLSVFIRAAPVVNNLSLEVAAGEILGLVGASGSGKSMTALAIMRLLPPAASPAGDVRLLGENLTDKSNAQMQAIRGRDMAMVFQDPMNALNPLLRIGEQVAETVRLHRSVSQSVALQAARDTLDLVGLPTGAGAAHRG
jgi:peptide/nickel transport system ATP-binding protein